MPIPAGGSNTSTLVPWAPTLVKVADRIPGRTLVPSPATGANTSGFTFDSTTRPPGATVTRLIDDSIAWVQSATGPVIDSSLYNLATAVAAVYTAASVERGYPERESTNEKDATVTADRLFKQADDMLARLAARNQVLVGGEDPEIFEIVAPWSYPPGVPDDLGLTGFTTF